ncbi:uncharacterized protein L201_000116 [Kwoniella dendrophila CBS 6074]|uniref:Uncharacterized protein n=1 Tax=Kwoniella dendrophila CBS 6074 TaxID=1295534 RepID=A0AAX4JKG3_9TREE
MSSQQSSSPGSYMILHGNRKTIDSICPETTTYGRSRIFSSSDDGRIVPSKWYPVFGGSVNRLYTRNLPSFKDITGASQALKVAPDFAAGEFPICTSSTEDHGNVWVDGCGFTTKGSSKDSDSKCIYWPDLDMTLEVESGFDMNLIANQKEGASSRGAIARQTVQAVNE